MNISERIAGIRDRHVNTTLLPNANQATFANSTLNQNVYEGDRYNTIEAKAAAWIAHCSFTIKRQNNWTQEVQRIAGIIHNKINTNVDLTDINDLDRLHREILGTNYQPRYRPAAFIVGDHGFYDGNGRLGCIAFAIATIQQNIAANNNNNNNNANFVAPDKPTEQQMHGLG
ncbi:hypothetical protein [Marinibactrum halimedae]|uniref:Fido domain-containing protein n=1 Tax=Marinibactrum halimedae TaxID=1444977 RepID=A0AA37T6N0_9GAMM|nr:hypothetical protein [Marinibactrum halimedae]MCD9459085.1 hypothetical protein [Marinibactrum halimedae]GLS24686.1 hypothetical protein GCM10007877_04000 [Marinibactrum halimedae]